jgi:hypothetical protein
VKNDPKLVAAARELRDRRLERVEGTEAPAIAAVSGLSQAAMKNGTGPT